MTFFNRALELDWLERGWSSGKPEFRILFGRRRVGTFCIKLLKVRRLINSAI
jgi:AAA+ ATPase superfamily predicted ATPase